jgi:DNA-binding transcriptional LysR family regulator
MTLLKMCYILEIERCGSMNKAAQNLFMSQSALSSAIGEVEKELGIQIFRRSNRGMTLTDEGRELAARIAPIVESSRELQRYYERRKASEPVQLSIAAQRYPFCAAAFVELLHSIGQQPMQLSLKEMDMISVIGDVASGNSGLGVIFVSDRTDQSVFRALQENNLQFIPLLTLRPHVFMRKGHPLSGMDSLTVEQLLDYPNVVFTQTDSNPNFAEEAVAMSGVDNDRMVYVSDRATIYNIMTHSDCISTGSGILPPGFSDAGLLAVPLRDSRNMTLGTIQSQHRPLGLMEQRFVEILRQVVEEIEGALPGKEA